MALDVDSEDGVDLTTLHIGQGPEMFDAGVADGDIEAAEFAMCGFEHGFYFFFVGDVGFEDEGAHSVGADLLRDGLGGCAAGEVVECYVCASLGVFEGYCGADAAAGAGDWVY